MSLISSNLSVTSLLIIISDDITVEVIFFGESVNDGSVTINKEATASAESAKPKL